MIDESRVADAGALSPRAGVALLTLQLRSTLQEAISAEAEVASVDVDAELWQLRSRLGPLMEERRQALAADLVAEREHAEAAVAAARSEAAQIVADARNRAEAAAEQAARTEAARRAAAVLAERQAAIVAAAPLVAAPPVAEAGVIEAAPVLAAPVLESPALESPFVEPPSKPHLFDDPLLDWSPNLAPATLPPPSETPLLALSTIIEAPSEAGRDVPAEPIIEAPVAPVVEAPIAMLAPPTAASLYVPAIDAPVDDSGWAAEPPVPTSTMVLPVTVTDAPAGSSDPRAMHVVIDADSFARAFAAALAPVLEARNQAPVYPPQAYMPVPAPAPKKSFWAHAWHPDVLLSGLAMVIVIIVLVAWTG